METLKFHYPGGQRPARGTQPVLAGVLGSGNLEVLVEPAAARTGFHIEVRTAAVGFGPIWQAVLDDIFQRWPLADVRLSINDAGATPAVVALRIDQALAQFAGQSA